MVPQIRAEFERLVSYVTTESHEHTAYTVELALFRRLLALGRLLLRLFFATRASTRPEAPTLPDGSRMLYHERRSVRYVSVFGPLRLGRHYFTATGQPGACPLDAALSLPEHSFSDLVREWAAFATTDGAYRECQTILERILGLTLSVQSLEQHTARDAADVETFYAQPPAPHEPVAAASILVLQADGKGVPLLQQPIDPPARRQAGQVRTGKKEAVVTCLYSIAPYRRTPEEVAAALLKAERTEPPRARPRPLHKEQHATLEGKEVAFTRLAERAAQREGEQIQHRVALTDGAEALQTQMQRHFPQHTLVLDIMHASDYLWEAATALVGEAEAKRRRWLRPRLVQLLDGKVSEVIAELEEAAALPKRTRNQRNALERARSW
jgi:hypothetical protein